MRLVGTYHEQRMCVLGLVRSGQRDETKENRGGACGRSASRIDNANRIVSGLPFLIGAIKKNRLCTKKSLII